MTKMMYYQEFLVLSFLLGTTVSMKSYNGDKVITVTPESVLHLKYLQFVQQTTDIDFWRFPANVGTPVDIHLTPDQLDSIDDSFSRMGIDYMIKVNDISRLLRNEKMRRFGTRFNVNDILTRYGSEQEIISWLESAANQCGSRCTLMPFGTSLEGRQMQAIKIVGAGNVSGTKPAVFVDGGIHAREWISPVFVNNMISKLINDYDSDSEVRSMLDNFDWYIIPILNPDGYQYSHDSDRMWRKNRATTSNARCRGIDLNRNFGYQWGVDGVSNNPCSEIYLGTSAFSEPESQALRDFLTSIQNLKVYLTVHSYGQYILYPWGYGRDYAPNHNDLDDVGRAAGRAIKSITGEDWIVGNAAIELYPAAGASDDWAYAVGGATYAYTIELPPSDNSGGGFILPERQIPQVVNSVWPGVKALMARVLQKQTNAIPTHYGNAKQTENAGVKQAVFHDHEWWKRILLKKMRSQKN